MAFLQRTFGVEGLSRHRAEHARKLWIISGICMAFTSIMLLTSGQAWPTRVVNSSALLLTSVTVLVMCLCRVHITKPLSCLFVALCAVFVSVADIDSRSIGSAAMWPQFVLLADLALVLRLGRGFATGLIAVAAVWVILTGIESITRFGLFDLPGTAPEWHRWERTKDTVDCTSPPCPETPFKAIVEMGTSVYVLIMDFIATRGFAYEAEKEQAAMARTIETVEAIAKLLAGYDVDTVAEMLQEAEAEGRLPAAMHEALQRLEQNLRAYRPYLPEALFETQDEDCRFASLRAAPGAINEEVAIVFTDVRASTSIWEAAPEAMKKAMQTHNMVMRDAIRLLGGYEVKTIGDAFMVAFEQARVAVDFALLVQDRLLDAEWPAALLEVPICSRSELWGGLTVRVGVNHGPVTLETNALTGRVDYFGHTVNVAARLEGVCIPGAVAVPADLWAQVGGSCLPAVVGPAVPADLKGVSEALPMRHVWPAGLAGRQRDVLHNDDLRTGCFDAAVTSVSDSRSSHSRVHDSKAPRMRETAATVATVSLCTIADNSTAADISLSLEAVMPLLQQSRGSLVTLLGENVFVGWNLVQAVPVHAESAVQFAQRVLRLPCGAEMTVGLASGTVHHGDVGTTSQRFVTAAGRTVEASLQVWRLARDTAVRCLYTAAQGSRLGALQAILRPVSVMPQTSTATIGPVYEIVQLGYEP